MTGPTDSLHERVREAALRYELLDGVRSVLVGVSGGQDSVALLHALVILWPQLRVGAIHVHHGMRGAEADADAACVRGLCESLGAEFVLARRNIPAECADSGMNPEQVGRLARYEEYEKAASQRGFDRIATGHTGTDRAETLLLNLFRGAGLRGMSSIPPRRGRIIRPLVLATREETASYCRRHHLAICTDQSNLDPDYARRNVLRLCIMPAVEEHFPGAERALMRACEVAEEEIAWTEPLLQAKLAQATLESGSNAFVLDADALRDEHPAALHRLLRMALEEARGDLLELSKEHVERIAGLLEPDATGTVVELPGELQVRREYERLIIEVAEESVPLPDEQAPLDIPGEATLPARAVTVNAEPAVAPDDFAAGDATRVYLGVEAARGGLVLRSHRPGERFVPLGMTGSRKLQDFFTDEKVPREKRARIPVVADREGQILWIVGHRLAETARAEAGADAIRLTAQFAPPRDKEDT